MLVGLGYKEIEVSYPSASQTNFEFTRRLIETPNAVPEDVCLQVLSPYREDLIQRTVDSLRGANKAVLHLYLATSDCFQRVVFGFTQEESIALAVKCTRFARSITKDSLDAALRATEWSYEFTPENFSKTSPDFVIHFCEAVKKAWEPSESNPIIFNLLATVERTLPNIYADQVEFFCRNMTERDKICVSLHPHNDRGCAIAAAEMAQLAGADRVEGCLFGHGERTGNVDLVTLALNLYTQGISPNIDFSNISNVVSMVETCSNIPVHPRTPYAGSLVVCAFSGSHQDAIKKGFKDRRSSRRQTPNPSRNFHISHSTREISAVTTNPSSESTRSPARAVSHGSFNKRSNWISLAVSRSPSRAWCKNALMRSAVSCWRLRFKTSSRVSLVSSPTPESLYRNFTSPTSAVPRTLPIRQRWPPCPSLRRRS
jgi:2-isopropylmalate synthase